MIVSLNIQVRVYEDNRTRPVTVESSVEDKINVSSSNKVKVLHAVHSDILDFFRDELNTLNNPDLKEPNEA